MTLDSGNKLALSPLMVPPFEGGQESRRSPSLADDKVPDSLRSAMHHG